MIWNENISFSAKFNQLKTLKVQLHFWFAEFWQNCDCRDTEAFLKMRTTGACEGFIVERIPLLSHKGSRNELQMCFLSVVAAKENKSHPTNCEVMQTNKNTEWKIDFLPLHNLYFLKNIFRQPSWEYICKLIRLEWHDRDYNTMGGIQYKEEGHDFVMRMPTSGSPKWLRRHALPCPTSAHLHRVLHCHTEYNRYRRHRRSYDLRSPTFAHLLHRVQHCHTKSY